MPITDFTGNSWTFKRQIPSSNIYPENGVLTITQISGQQKCTLTWGDSTNAKRNWRLAEVPYNGANNTLAGNAHQAWNDKNGDEGQYHFTVLYSGNPSRLSCEIRKADDVVGGELAGSWGADAKPPYRDSE